MYTKRKKNSASKKSQAGMSRDFWLYKPVLKPAAAHFASERKQSKSAKLVVPANFFYFSKTIKLVIN